VGTLQSSRTTICAKKRRRAHRKNSIKDGGSLERGAQSRNIAKLPSHERGQHGREDRYFFFRERAMRDDEGKKNSGRLSSKLEGRKKERSGSSKKRTSVMMKTFQKRGR